MEDKQQQQEMSTSVFICCKMLYRGEIPDKKMEQFIQNIQTSYLKPEKQHHTTSPCSPAAFPLSPLVRRGVHEVPLGHRVDSPRSKGGKDGILPFPRNVKPRARSDTLQRHMTTTPNNTMFPFLRAEPRLCPHTRTMVLARATGHWSPTKVATLPGHEKRRYSISNSKKPSKTAGVSPNSFGTCD